ncbi:conserved exported hypothetical protein [Chryseobacterium sp. 8AT]|nr:conserved exported hypothetical protein [Chryseobacterium sp. 8AT]
MMKYKFLFFTLMVMILNSCGGSDSDDSTFINIPNPIPSTPPKTISLRTTTEIFPTSAMFRGNIVQQDGQGETPGFVYATTPNPTVINNASVTTIAQGSTNFEVKSGTLQPNTTYYVRGFIKTGEGIYTYTAETSFKTTGYFGPGGGYVAYDKGEIINGWRYMEIHPQSAYYGTSAQGAKWGDLNLFISGTYPDFGKGLENSIIIAANNPGVNCAAKVCLDLVRNGMSDWFLPSSQELLTLSKELKKANISLIGYGSIWSSTQKNDISAFDVRFELSGEVLISDMVKSSDMKVYPARRY